MFNFCALKLLKHLYSVPGIMVFVHRLSGGPLCLFIFSYLLRPLMVASEQSHEPGFTNKSFAFLLQITTEYK